MDSERATCVSCGRAYPAGRQRCGCGEPLWLETDASEYDWPSDDTTGMWRFADLLPVDPPTGLGAGVGGTPLVRTERLDAYAGCRLSVKDETRNPTGSFKDRGSAVGVAAVAERGDQWVGTVSHGNMGMSVAAHAASVGLDCLVFVPEDIPAERHSLIAQYDPELVTVRGSYGRLYEATVDSPLPVEFVNSDSPLRVAGQKTVAFEILEGFAPDAPDAIALPVSSGGNASAVWKALREARTAGLIDDIPRLYLVQAAACDPVATAYRGGADSVTPVEAGDTIAYSIANADPPSGTRALAAVRDTDGAVVSVTDDEIRDAMSVLSSRAGLCVEAASATALAGVRALSASGEVRPDERVVLVATGTGFKEGTGRATDVVSSSIDVDSFESAVRDRIEGS